MISIIYGALAVGVAMVLALVGLILVQHLVPSVQRQEHNDVAGFIYAVIGVVYAVLLALVVIAGWEDHELARETTEREANALADIFWLAHWLPDTEGQQLQELSRSYAQTVVDEEWPLMEQGRAAPRAWELLDEIRGSIGGSNPTTEAELGLYYQELEQVQDLADARRLRLVEAEEGIPAILWALVVFGGVVTVGFTYLFGLESTRTHKLMVMALAAVIGLVIFAIGALDYPFSGSTAIRPTAFELILERFETSELSTLR